MLQCQRPQALASPFNTSVPFKTFAVCNGLLALAFRSYTCLCAWRAWVHGLHAPHAGVHGCMGAWGARGAWLGFVHGVHGVHGEHVRVGRLGCMGCMGCMELRCKDHRGSKACMRCMECARPGSGRNFKKGVHGCMGSHPGGKKMYMHPMYILRCMGKPLSCILCGPCIVV